MEWYTAKKCKATRTQDKHIDALRLTAQTKTLYDLL